MVSTMRVYTDNMRRAAANGFINATDLADYLVIKGMPFRTAYKISGEAVAYCIAEHKTLETLTLEEFKNFSDVIENDVYDAINLENCANRRVSLGGTGLASVEKEIEWVKSRFN